MVLDAALFVGGLAVLLVGGEALVRGASALAARLGVSPATIGLTVVAFGTSAPELVVSAFGAFDGRPGIAFGNVVGSNVANVTLLLGATALVAPLTVTSALVLREMPMMVLASVAASVLALDSWLGDSDIDALGRGDGVMLLLLFGVFLYYTAVDVVRSRASDPLLRESDRTSTPEAAPGSRLVSTGLVVAGLAGLAFGGHLMVSSAIAIATDLGVPAVVIGTTIVAVGTSLPELATSVLAVRRGQTDMAAANLVGSNLFNLLFILGTTSTLAPGVVPSLAGVDLAFVTGSAVLVFALAASRARTITRAEGVLLLLVYGGYLAWQMLRPS